MSGTIQSPDTNQQTTVWLRGLVMVGWADGHFDQEEQQLIAALTQQKLSESETTTAIAPITPNELADVFGQGSQLAENFLRTAVMVALADRCYSEAEDQLLRQYCQVLKLNTDVLDALHQGFSDICTEAEQAEAEQAKASGAAALTPSEPHDLLNPVRIWLDQIEIHDPKVAHFLCRMIPPQCPFERDIHLLGRKVVHIPALCKLNPLYEQLVGIRFRALSYLADKCGEDVTPYC